MDLNQPEKEEQQIIFSEEKEVKRENDSITVPVEQTKMVYTLGRYADPLIAKKYHSLFNPVHREDVAEHDPLGSLLTRVFAQTACNRMLKFYANDELDSPEILQDLRLSLDSISLMGVLEDAICLAQIHGWAIIVPNVEEGYSGSKSISFEIFSEREIPADNIKRNERNRITHVIIDTVPDVPMRGSAGLKAIHYDLQRNQFFLITRGTARYGFGNSAFAASWDAITKLREISHSDHFRQKIMPISVVPPDWSNDQIKEYQKALSNVDMMTSLVTRAAENPQGDIYPDLPRTSLDAMAGDVRRTSAVSSPQISNLNSEWARLCAVCRHTVGFFVGGGIISASRAAAGVDQSTDVQACIDEFNLYRRSLYPILEWVSMLFGIKIPKQYVIKSHWEWERDEQLFANMQMQQLTMAMSMDNQQKDGQRREEESKRKNVVPNQFTPVNSSSGNVQSLFLEKDPYNTGLDKLWVQYQAPYNWYSYQDPQASNMEPIADDIIANGGSAVWSDLRKGSSAPTAPGQAPTGMPKKHYSGPLRPQPYAGNAHFMEYWPESSAGFIQTGGSQGPSPPTGVRPPSQGPSAGPSAQLEAPARPQEETVDSLLGSKAWWSTAKRYIQSIKSHFGRIFGFGARMNEYDQDEISPNEYIHPILARYNSISAAARELHKGKNTIYQMLDEIEENCCRINYRIQQKGNSLSSKNPFRYNINGQYRIEYQCPDAIKGTIGTDVPIIMTHDPVNPETLEPLPNTPIYGRYRINGYNEDGIEIAEYDWDMDALERDGYMDIIETIKSGDLPENSTGTTCTVRYNRDQKKYIQTNLKIHHLALVQKGNCSKPFCGVA